MDLADDGSLSRRHSDTTVTVNAAAVAAIAFYEQCRYFYACLGAATDVDVAGPGFVIVRWRCLYRQSGVPCEIRRSASKKNKMTTMNLLKGLVRSHTF